MYNTYKIKMMNVRRNNSRGNFKQIILCPNFIIYYKLFLRKYLLPNINIHSYIYNCFYNNTTGLQKTFHVKYYL